MHRNQRTLIAISGSIVDRNIMEYAARLAELEFARHYHLVHVRTASRAGDMARQKQELLEYMEKLLNNHFKCDRSKISASCHVMEGDQSPVAVLAVKHFGSMLNLFQVLRENQFWTSRGPKTN